MFGYVARLACVSLWRNLAMSSVAIVTTSLLLLILSGFLIVMTSLNVSVSALESKVNVIVYLRDNISPATQQALEHQLRADPRVRRLVYFSKADALQRLKQEFADRPGLIQAVQGNPLPASFEVTLTTPSLSAAFATQARTIGGVEEVDFKQNAVQRLLAITQFIRIAGLALMAGLTAAVVLIMVNVARLGIYARRQEIEIMRLVGASDWFVRWPFVVEGILCGLIAALVNVGALSLTYQRIIRGVGHLLSFLPLNFDPAFFYKLALIALVLGVSVGGGGSLFAVRRFWEAER